MNDLESDEDLRGRVGRRLFLMNIYLPTLNTATGSALDSLAILVGIRRGCSEKPTVHNEQNNLINQGDLNMAITTRAPKTVTIIDNNKFVDDNDSVIFEVSGIFSGEDKDILLQIMAENDIPTFLAQYNESRVQVVDQEKQIQSGIAGFKLPPLKIRDLTSSEVSILIK